MNKITTMFHILYDIDGPDGSLGNHSKNKSLHYSAGLAFLGVTGLVPGLVASSPWLIGGSSIVLRGSIAVASALALTTCCTSDKTCQDDISP